MSPSPLKFIRPSVLQFSYAIELQWQAACGRSSSADNGHFNQFKLRKLPQQAIQRRKIFALTAIRLCVCVSAQPIDRERVRNDPANYIAFEELRMNVGFHFGLIPFWHSPFNAPTCLVRQCAINLSIVNACEHINCKHRYARKPPNCTAQKLLPPNRSAPFDIKCQTIKCNNGLYVSLYNTSAATFEPIRRRKGEQKLSSTKQ